MWNKINVKDFNSFFCRQNCIHKDYCFYYDLRQKLLSTNGIILCNQDLLTINLRKRYSYSKELLTDKFQYVVIDEAHNLESKVRNSYTAEVNYNSLCKTIEQARKISRGITSLIDSKIRNFYKALDSVFSQLEVQIRCQDEIAEKKGMDIERYRVDRNIPYLKRLKDCIHDIFLEVSMQFGVDDSYKNKDYDTELEALELLEEFFSSMLERESNDIFWMNIKGKGKKRIYLSKCPKDVNRLTQKLFFSDEQFSMILTSATITSGNSNEYIDNYKYFISNTNFPVENSIIPEPKKSPFNYDAHAMIYYTENVQISM